MFKQYRCEGRVVEARQIERPAEIDEFVAGMVNATDVRRNLHVGDYLVRVTWSHPDVKFGAYQRAVFERSYTLIEETP